MALVTRIILTLTLILTIAAALQAQETTTAASETSDPSPAVAEEAKAEEPPAPQSSFETRNQFTALLRNGHPELARILTLDPTLLNPTYLAGYPDVARYVASHPEILRNPHFFLADFQVRPEDGVLSDAFEALVIFSTFLLIFFALAWFVRTVIEQKRWTRLARTQSEVHNKILDRFASSEEVLQYIRTPAGAKFLESAPIPVRADQATPQNQPVSRVMWSIQIGVVVAAAALGMLVVSIRYDGPTGNDLFAMGAIAFCIGIGFIASAVVSLLLSRRLGLWQGPDGAPSSAVEEPGGVR